MTDQDWKRLVQGFDPHLLRLALNELDAVREHFVTSEDFAEDDELKSFSMRNEVAMLQELATAVMHHGQRDNATRLFEDADDLHLRLVGVIGVFQQLQATLEMLLDLQPEPLDASQLN
ncbi:MAG: hypothetical protein HC933_03995 [Pleurocapsa sp. SU_196_0]|nr:hypothetical protein [Pleurocapsa sp. SU_196_0]